jgi:hypothetical protein
MRLRSRQLDGGWLMFGEFGIGFGNSEVAYLNDELFVLGEGGRYG